MPNFEHHERKKLGLCVLCAGQPEPGKLKCEPCRIKSRDASKRHEAKHPNSHTRQKRKSRGLCECGAAPESGTKTCAACKAKNRRKATGVVRRRQAAGLCATCGGKRDGGGRLYCSSCRKKQKERADRRIEKGLCSSCSRPARPGRKLCEQCGERSRATMARKLAENRRKVFDYYGRSCRCCGCNFEPFLSIDHVHGGGTKHRKSLGTKSGSSFYGWLVRQGFPEGFQVLCFSCNCRKGFRRDHSNRCDCQDWTQQRIDQSAGTLMVF